MANSKTTKRALLSSVLALLVCVTMLIGTTFAWFTDNVTSVGNKIVSGNLDIDLYLWNDADTSVEITDESDPIFGSAGLAQNSTNTLWEPGKTQVVYLSLKNNGSLDLKYKVGVDVENPANSKNLYEVMQYAITNDAKYGEVTSWTNGNEVVEGINTTAANDVVLGAGDEHFFALSIHMEESAGNEYKDGQVNFDIKVLATQLASEEDSFGKDYDAKADYDGEIGSFASLLTALEAGGTYNVVDDVVIPEGEKLSIPEGISVVLNLNDNGISGSAAKSDDDSGIINNKGDLTIIADDNAIFTNSTVNGAPLVYNEGTLTLDGGKYIGSAISGDTSYPEYAIYSMGKLTVEEGTYIESDRGALRLHGETIINGGTFIVTDAVDNRSSGMTLHTVAARSGSSIVINGGTFENNYTVGGGSSVICPWGGDITINDGTFRDAVDTHVDHNSTANIQNYMGSGSKINIYGGTYDDNSVVMNVKAPYAAYQDEDGIYFVADENSIYVTTLDGFKSALANAEDGQTISLLSDMAGDVTVDQPGDKEVSLVIDGRGHKYDGQITIKGHSSNGKETLTIKNFNFESSTKSREFIWSGESKNGTDVRYAHNVTIDNCTFTASGDAVHTAVGAKFQQSYNIKLTNCTATNMHSLLQAESCASNVTVENSSVVNGKNGVSFNNTMNATIKNTRIESVVEGGYGIRHKGEVNGYKLTVDGCTVKAFVPVLIRNMKGKDYVATFNGTNTLTATNDFGYQIVLSAGDWDDDSAKPSVPTGTYTLNGAEGFNIFK